MNLKELKKNTKEEEYTELENELALIEIPSEINEFADEEKMREILSKRRELFDEDDEQMAGVNLSIEAKNTSLEREAQKYCAHEFEIEVYKSLTRLLLKTIERTVSCKNCSFEQIDKVTDNPSEEQIENWANR